MNGSINGTLEILAHLLIRNSKNKSSFPVFLFFQSNN